MIFKIFQSFYFVLHHIIPGTVVQHNSHTDPTMSITWAERVQPSWLLTDVYEPQSNLRTLQVWFFKFSKIKLDDYINDIKKRHTITL